jgi:plasmid stabilization system protein ParE
LRHVIYYREVDYGIEIIRVLHDHQLATRHL